MQCAFTARLPTAAGRVLSDESLDTREWGAGSQPPCMRATPHWGRSQLAGRSNAFPKLDLQALLALPGVCDH